MVDTDNFTEQDVLQALENLLTANGVRQISEQKKWPFELRNLCAHLYQEHPTVGVSDIAGAQFIHAATKQRKGIAPIIDELISRGVVVKNRSPEWYTYFPQLD